MAANPFRPGFNQRPEVLAGRDDVLDAADDAVEVVAERRTPRPLVLVGPRGVGKTVLLTEIADRVGTSLGWPRLRVEAAPRAATAAHLLHRAAAVETLFDRAPHPGTRGLRTRSVSLSGDLPGGVLGGAIELERRPEAARPPTDRWLEAEAAVERVAEAAARLASGVILTVDEAHELPRPDFAMLAALLQRATEEAWPFVTVIAGLPTIRSPRRMVTYLERAEWHHVGSLDPGDTLAALAGPAAGAGRPMEPAAAQHLAARCAGYPYGIQVFGSHAWRASAGAQRISLAAARAGAVAAEVELEGSLYAARWEMASLRERTYLVAVAELLAGGGEPGGGDVARHLGLRSSELSVVRDRLLAKGILVADGSSLGVAVPGFADYVLRRASSG